MTLRRLWHIELSSNCMHSHYFSYVAKVAYNGVFQRLEKYDFALYSSLPYTSWTFRPVPRQPSHHSQYTLFSLHSRNTTFTFTIYTVFALRCAIATYLHTSERLRPKSVIFINAMWGWFECGHHVGWFTVERSGAACTLVLVYVSIRLRETVSEFRSIERFSTADTVQHATHRCSSSHRKT